MLSFLFDKQENAKICLLIRHYVGVVLIIDYGILPGSARIINKMLVVL